MSLSLCSRLLGCASDILLLVHPESLQIAEAGGALAKLGYCREDLLGRPITEIECALSDVFFWEEVRQGGGLPAQNVEGSYLCADGNILAALKTVVRLEGDEVLIAVRAQPSEALRSASDELADVTSHLRATLEASADGILLMDRAGSIINMNRRFSQMWKIPDQVLNSRSDEAITRYMAACCADPDDFLDRVSRIRTDTEDETFGVLNLRDGEVFECKSRPARQDEQIIGRVFTYSDVTERYQTQLELIRARDQAKAASRAKGEFLAMMSHEIRTPMNGIIGNAQLLATTPLDTEQAEYVRTIGASGEALLAIINDILDYSKIEAGKLKLENTAFNLPELLNDIEQLFVARIRERAVGYSSMCAEGLPQTLVGDSTRLRQILVNLVGNAFKFTSHGEIRLAVERAGEESGQIRLRFSVRDTGIGIPRSKLDHIFNPFEQADGSTTRRYGGTGLGLSICKQLTTLMGGEVGVDSVEGVGSEFWFVLPFRTSDSVVQGVGRPAAALPQSLRRNTRVLVADDNRVNQILLVKMLEKLGTENIVMVGSGLQAVEACWKQTFDLIFMDARMPDMDGLEATRSLRNYGVTARIIGVSADAMVEDAQAALAAGMDDYLSKPVTIDALVAAVGRWRESLRS